MYRLKKNPFIINITILYGITVTIGGMNYFREGRTQSEKREKTRVQSKYVLETTEPEKEKVDL